MTISQGTPSTLPLPTVSASAEGTVPMSMPWVRIWPKPSAMPSVPSVTISGGTLALAIRKPFSAPQPSPAAIPAPAPSAITPQPAAGPLSSAFMVRTETTPEKISTEPTERSIPAVTMTKVCPTASSTRIADSVAMLRNSKTVAKAPGRRIEKTATRAARTRKVQTVFCPRSLRRTSRQPLIVPPPRS